ncbi:1-acyl-sn-glycerol-3-phosphate acyltransferase [Mucilaginibacter lappiensis]|uniref:1-acyl-sn-glycerol-3-phosphate acyltransferase n=1 Tax=Mucilaginibacter lappiensis TaxID=354630 RepID=A0ABR6PEF4_9SPHI|nr:1-acyl-sn-glycerol-3-phosphate acyltransferase [Mucilaginibacter lappiensis]MBB6108112.1 1-acyl-sn-glycerol-3-phosphate acyltransferase [Mucilaginibacter lappiensis]SIS11498.1 1-acyl-sn-glycerol-3-phosphate acyltransferase [Mucilaginibacter lappiensis]
MLPSRQNDTLSRMFYRFMRWWMGRNFKEINIQPFEPRAGHSILLLTNHFSWWDGFFANYAAFNNLKRRLYIMMQHDHFLKHWYFKYLGAFSMKKGSREMLESLTYSAGLLNNPENLVTIFPQGALYSNHETYIHVENGIERLIKQIKGPCQIVYQCTLIDYFEGLKPRAYMHHFDCGVTGEVSFEELKQRINNFHQQALKKQANMEH